MKDSEAKFEEWWEVVEEYFVKELEKNMAQHRANERILKYKLEIYQKNFLDFMYGTPKSTKVQDKDEEAEARASGIAQEEEVQMEEPLNLKGEIIQEKEVQTKKLQDLKGMGQEEKKPQITQEQKQMDIILATKEEVSKIQPLEIGPQTKLMEKEVRIAEMEVGT